MVDGNAKDGIPSIRTDTPLIQELQDIEDLIWSPITAETQMAQRQSGVTRWTQKSRSNIAHQKESRLWEKPTQSKWQKLYSEQTIVDSKQRQGVGINVKDGTNRLLKGMIELHKFTLRMVWTATIAETQIALIPSGATQLDMARDGNIATQSQPWRCQKEWRQIESGFQITHMSAMKP